MKKMKHHVKKKFHIFKDMHFFQRMTLIYVIGGIIPLLGASIYTNSQMHNIMIDLSRETQSEEIVLLGSSINESMTVLENVARLLCLSDEVRRLATKEYSGSTDFFKDYYGTSAITEYLNYYQQDISYINVYIDNSSVSQEDIQKADNLTFLSPAVRVETWYQETIDLNNAGYWYVGTMPGSDQQTIQISRAMRNKKGKVIAVVTVLMQFHKTVDALTERSVDTMLLYNNDIIVSANYDAENRYPFLREQLEGFKENSLTQRVVYGVEEYLITCEKVFPSGYSDYYSLVSIQKYQDIMANVNKISLRAFMPEAAGIILSMVLILAFSVSYGRRMKQLRVQMSHVAQGEYDKVQPVEGNDEIGELYQELEQMIKDIQKLTSVVVNEQVQKEKLHTRQKEVEFKMLASQINPHFLYNTLETIRMKAMVNHQPEIVELVKMLAKTMRYHIQVTEQLVALKAELQMVEYYLKIQEYRFGDRITSSVEVDPDVDRNALIMPLIIQPFVENAFVHGLEEKDKDGKITVHVSMSGEDIQIVIWDNGEGMDYFQLGKLRQSLHEENTDQSHIGVHNVNQRIKIFYGEDYGIQIESKRKLGTKVTLRLPYQLEEDGNL